MNEEAVSIASAIADLGVIGLFALFLVLIVRRIIIMKGEKDDALASETAQALALQQMNASWQAQLVDERDGWKAIAEKMVAENAVLLKIAETKIEDLKRAAKS